MGTAHVLEALRELPSARVAVMVTTDKVYRDMRVGLSPIAKTIRSAATIPTAPARRRRNRHRQLPRTSYLVRARRRGGERARRQRDRRRRLVAGPPDPRRRARLAGGQTLDVRRPQAVRPWQHVLEPLAGYLTLAQHLWERPALAGAYNFGPMPAAPSRCAISSSWHARPTARARCVTAIRRRRPARSRLARAGSRQGRERARRFAEMDAGRSGQAHDGLVSRAARRQRCARAVRGGYCGF